MKKKGIRKLVFLISVLLIFYLSGCSLVDSFNNTKDNEILDNTEGKEENNNNHESKEDIIPDETNSNEEVINKNDNIENKTPDEVCYDLDKIKKISGTLKDLGLKDISVGYNYRGDITVWCDIIIDKYKYNNEDKYTPSRAYHVYLAKKVFDNIDNIAELWLYTVNRDKGRHYISQISYETYEDIGLVSAPKDIETLYETDLYKKVDNIYYANTTVCYSGGPYDPWSAIERQVKEFFDDRLENVEINFFNVAVLDVTVTVKSLPNNSDPKSIYKEMAKLRSIIHGRFRNSRNGDNVYKLQVIYKQDDDEEIKIDSNLDYFDSWVENEMNISELNLITFNEDTGEFYYPSELTEEEKSELDNLTKKEEYNENLTYEQIMTKLKKIKGVEVAHFGYQNDKGTLVFKMDGGTDEEVFSKQMELTHEIMKLPIDSLWFISEGEDKTRVTHIDREQYNVLTYLKGYRDVDIQIKEWPIVVTTYLQSELEE